MYSLIRFLFFIIVLIITLVIILTSKIKKKKIAVIIAVVCLVVLRIIVTHIAFENLFYKFNSPEEVYRYVNTFEKSEIVDVVNAEKSAVVISKGTKKTVYLSVLKSGDKWAIDPASYIGTEYVFIDEDYVINIIKSRTTNEYFINVYDLKGNKKPIITDNIGSEFAVFEGDGLVTYNCYAFLKSFDENYSISINGTEITAEEIMKNPVHTFSLSI